MLKKKPHLNIDVNKKMCEMVSKKQFIRMAINNNQAVL